MTKDYWVTAALTKDSLVAELLLRLKESDYYSPSHRPPPSSPPPLVWGGFRRRQRRSRPNNNITGNNNSGGGGGGSCSRKEPARCSPTTPLSWSGGGGAAASTSDGYDESSRPSDRSSGDRSKTPFGSESATTASNKKQRKRKSFTELKEEEGFLLEERMHLKRELASMQATFKEQIARSENFKRIKLDLHLQQEKPLAGNLYQLNQTETTSTSLIMPSDLVYNNSQSFGSLKVENTVEPQKEKGFVLPDLNMTPGDEEGEEWGV